MKIIRIVLLVLIAIMGILIFVNKNTSESSDKIITLKYKNKTVNISYNILNKMKNYNITDSKGKKYTGIKLQELLQTITKNRINKVVLLSKDGIKIDLEASEIPNSYLVQQIKNGERYYRLAIPSDEFKQRWLKYIVKISIE